MSTMEKRIYKGKAAKNHLSHYFLTSSKINITFKQVVSEAFYIKLFMIGENQLYPFTLKYHNRLKKIKFELEDSKEYYIWEKDVENFDIMSKEEQLNYLKSVTFDNMCIGSIDSTTIQSYLYNKYIKIDNKMKGVTEESDLLANKWWFITNIEDVYISILSNRLIAHGDELEFEIEYKKNPIPTYKYIFENLTNELTNSGLFIVKNTKENKGENYASKQTVCSRNFGSALFDIYIKQDLYGYTSRMVAFFSWNTAFIDLLKHYNVKDLPEKLSSTKLTNRNILKDTLCNIADYFYNVAQKVEYNGNDPRERMSFLIVKQNLEKMSKFLNDLDVSAE